MFGLRQRRADEQRAIQATAWGDWGDAYQTWAGVNVTTDSSLQLLAVYGCNRFICEGISTLPVDVFRELPDGTRQEIALPPWLHKPTPYLDRVAWLTQVLTSLLLDGNAYLHLRYSEGRLIELEPLNPALVKVRRVNGRKTFFVNGVQAGDLDILHIPGLMFPGSDVGLSPVEMARQTIGAGMSADEYAARFFGQGASMSGVIEVPGDMPAEGAGSAKELAKQFNRRHSGKNKAHLPAVLVAGAKWQSTGVTNEQAQFLQTRQFTAAQIASMMFLIDPTEFGMSMDKGSSITYANLEQRNARKVTVTYLPWLVRLEHAISELLARPRFMKFNVNGLLRGDTKTRYESYRIANPTDTWLAADEIRAFEDLPPLPSEPAPTTEAPTDD